MSCPMGHKGRNDTTENNGKYSITAHTDLHRINIIGSPDIVRMSPEAVVEQDHEIAAEVNIFFHSDISRDGKNWRIIRLRSMHLVYICFTESTELNRNLLKLDLQCAHHIMLFRASITGSVHDTYTRYPVNMDYDGMFSESFTMANDAERLHAAMNAMSTTDNNLQPVVVECSHRCGDKVRRYMDFVFRQGDEYVILCIPEGDIAPSTYQVPIQSIPHPCFVIGDKGKIVAVNNKAASFFPFVAEGNSIEQIMWDSCTRQRHAGYLSTYRVTQCSSILGGTSNVLARHANGASMLCTLKVESLPGDLYLGLVDPREGLWVHSVNGMIMGASPELIRIAGYELLYIALDRVILDSGDGIDSLCDVVTSSGSRKVYKRCTVQTDSRESDVWVLENYTPEVKLYRKYLQQMATKSVENNADQLRSFSMHEISNHLLILRDQLTQGKNAECEATLSNIENTVRYIMNCGKVTEMLEWEPSTENIYRLFNQVVTMVQAPEATIRNHVDESVCLNLPPIPFKAAMMNLITNSLKANPCTNIDIRMNESGVIEISDTSGGIPQHLLTELNAAVDAIHTVERGHGQGMTIMKRMLKESGYRVFAQLHSKGTVFKVFESSIDSVVSNRVVETKQEYDHGAHIMEQLENGQVIIMDDSVSASLILGKKLEKEWPSLTVHRCSTLEEWNALSKQNIHVCFMDYNLGAEVTGADLLAQLDDRTVKIGITGNCREGDFEYDELIRCGALVVMGKPFPHSIRAYLRNVLANLAS